MVETPPCRVLVFSVFSLQAAEQSFGEFSNRTWLCTWVQHYTVFGKEYEEQWYIKKVTACALVGDTALGNLTQIGRRPFWSVPCCIVA